MTFRDLNLNSSLWNALDDLGMTQPTVIQEKVMAPILAGKDVVGIAQTGTGKTLAYLLPMLRLWKFSKSPNARILVIVPTRELVAQVVETVEQLTTYMNVKVTGVYGGTNIKTHRRNVNAGVDIIVGTPGRLMDLMLEGTIKGKYLHKLIIDEVDEMLNLGFRTQLKNIVDLLPAKRQNLMFSATMIEEVEEVIHQFSKFYEKIEAAPSGTPLENIDQFIYEVPNFNTKANLLELLLQTTPEMKKVLVFTATKKMADALHERMLEHFEEKMGVIHSSKSQNNRFDTVNKFQDGSYRFIVATDIVARGLDVSEVTHVVNFDMPDVAEKYMHRIGRTGRAKQKGIAISFVAEKDKTHQEEVETLMGLTINKLDNPEDLEVTDELIQLEIPVEFVPFNNHKIKKVIPSGPAFHEKKAKNQKVNRKVRYEDKMKKKYKKQYRKKR